MIFIFLIFLSYKNFVNANTIDVLIKSITTIHYYDSPKFSGYMKYFKWIEHCFFLVMVETVIWKYVFTL